MKYIISGTVIDSNITIPQLEPVESDRNDIEFSITYEKLSKGGYEPLRDLFSNGYLWMSVYRNSSGYLLELPDCCYFIILTEQQKIICNPLNNVSIDTVRYFLLNHVIPLYLNNLGFFVLHCSGIKVGEKAVLFIGQSSMGKSTIASMLCNRGYDLITDDFMLLKKNNKKFFAVPSYPSLRLDQDSIAHTFKYKLESFKSYNFFNKTWIVTGMNNIKFCKHKVPIHAVYILDNPDNNIAKSGTTFEPVSVHTAFNSILKNCFLLDIHDEKTLNINFEYIINLIKRVNIKKIKYRKEFPILQQITELILNDIGS